MSLFTVGGMAGFAIGPLLITPILIHFGTHGATVLAVPVLFMSLAVTIQLPRLAAVQAPEPGDSANESDISTLLETREQWGDFTRLTIVVMFRSIVFFGLNTFIPLYWTHVLGGTKTGAGLALTTLLAAVTVGTLLGGRLADLYGRRIVIVVSLAALGPIMFVFASSHGLTIAAILLIPVGIALAASTSVVVVMAQEYLPNRIGLAAGVTLGLSMTIGGLMMPLFGSIADHYGLSTTIFLLSRSFPHWAAR